MQRVFHPVAVHFKGKGFYNTDYGTRRRNRELERSGKDGADKTESKSKDSLVRSVFFVVVVGEEERVEEVGLEVLLVQEGLAVQEAPDVGLLLGVRDGEAGAPVGEGHAA